jgi:hypothetical protein
MSALLTLMAEFETCEQLSRRQIGELLESAARMLAAPLGAM